MLLIQLVPQLMVFQTPSALEPLHQTSPSFLAEERGTNKCEPIAGKVTKCSELFIVGGSQYKGKGLARAAFGCSKERTRVLGSLKLLVL